jgi:hypothetical protein
VFRVSRERWIDLQALVVWICYCIVCYGYAKAGFRAGAACTVHTLMKKLKKACVACLFMHWGGFAYFVKGR